MNTERGVIVKVAMMYDKAKGDAFKQIQAGAGQAGADVAKTMTAASSQVTSFAQTVRTGQTALQTMAATGATTMERVSQATRAATADMAGLTRATDQVAGAQGRLNLGLEKHFGLRRMIGGMVFGAGLHALGAGLRDASSTSLDEMVEAEAAKANGEAGTGFWKDSGLLSGKAAMRTRGVVKKVPLFGDFLGGLADFGSLGAREGLEEAMAMEQRAKNMKALKEGFRGAGLSAAGIGKEDQLAFTDKMAAAQRGLVGDAKELFVLDQQRARLLKDAADAAREQHELMRGQGATAKMLTDAHQKHHGLLTQLATVEARRLDIMRQQSKEALEQQKADIMGKLSGVQSGLAGEDARLMAMQERFGEMSAEERSRVFDVGRRFRAGGLGAISDEERGVIQPFMGDQLQSAFRARGADPFARLMQEFGLGVRREELRQQEKMLLEAKITIENKLKAEIDINGRAVAEQLQQSLLPQIIKTMQDMNAAVSADFARRAFQVRAGNAAANPP